MDKDIALRIVDALLEILGERHGKKAGVLRKKVEAIREDILHATDL